MRKSYRNEKNNNNRADFSIAALACPRCGSGDTRLSRHTSHGLLKPLFYESYRCSACHFRFRVLSPLRLFLFAGLMLALVSIIGVWWLDFHQPAAVPDSVQTVAADDSIKSLAEQGDAEAELKMGLRYASTAWGMKNDKIAVLWFEKAAHHDQVEAQYHYGLALLKGLGVVQDYKTAFYWREKAAQQGHAEAQFALGEMYHSGIGTKTDIERAYLWFNLAAAQGIESAVSARDLVVKLLTPVQITAIQEEAGRISRDQRAASVVLPKVKVKDPDSTVVETPHPLGK